MKHVRSMIVHKQLFPKFFSTFVQPRSPTSKVWHSGPDAAVEQAILNMVDVRPDHTTPETGKLKILTPAIRRPGPPRDLLASTPNAAPAELPYPRPSLPRISFSGRFYADPSTVNNVVSHYDVEKFRPSYQLPGEHGTNGSWNPDGMATFAFVNCKITHTYSPSAGGPPPEKDALVGESIEYNRKSVYGKISDLDPQMQQVSTLYGVKINVGNGASSDAFTSVLKPTAFRDIWNGVDLPGMSGYAAVYQGFLDVKSFRTQNSTFLNECLPYVCDEEGNVLHGRGLSVRFRVDAFCPYSTKEDFCYGNVTGFITPWLPGNPLTFDVGRQLAVHLPSGKGPIEDDRNEKLCNTAYAVVEKMPNHSHVLFVDLVNSLFRERATGTLSKFGGDKYKTWSTPYKDMGRLQVGFFDTPDVPESFCLLGDVFYKSKEFEDCSCVVTFPLSDKQYEAIQTKQLCLRASPVDDDYKCLYYLAEAQDGLFCRADRFVYHLQGHKSIPDEDEHVARIFCTKWGVPQQSQVIAVGFHSMKREGGEPQTGLPIMALRVNGKTPDAKQTPDEFATTVKSNEGGFASLPLVGGDCRNAGVHPRGFIDGQLYFLRYAAGPALPPAEEEQSKPDCERINILLFSAFDGPKHPDIGPSWLVDVQPVLRVYANLYPAMHRIVRLDDYGSVKSRAHALQRVFGLENTDDPMYMPTTRDLSDAKRTMLLDWLRAPTLPFMNTTTDDLRALMQTLVEVEHATLPPYLTALFSIKPGYNQFVADTLRGIAYEEMHHLGLACNILTAIGGTPNLCAPGFVPKFPGPLPSGLRSGLIVRLRKCSLAQIKAFASIEAPDEQHVVENGTSTTRTRTVQNKYTIDWLYGMAKSTLKALHKSGQIHLPDDVDSRSAEYKRRIACQVESFGGQTDIIKSLRDALAAIDLITTEGEGSPRANSPFEHPYSMKKDGTGQPTLAHYFRFRQIIEGKQLVVNRVTRSYSYEGPTIDLDMDGVYNMQDDPKIELQPKGTKQRERMESFARKYQSLLNGLQLAFTGGDKRPQKDEENKYGSAMERSYAMMYQLTISAEELMKMPALNPDGSPKEDGTTCGVSFQVPLRNAEL